MYTYARIFGAMYTLRNVRYPLDLLHELKLRGLGTLH